MRILLIALALLVGGIATPLLANEAQCDALIQQANPDPASRETTCLEAAKDREKKHQYGVAAWYYFLAGKHRYNLETIAPKITDRDGLFPNIAHSCVLLGDWECATKYYGAYLAIVQAAEGKRIMAEDYALLPQLFPEQKERIAHGKALWDALYQKAIALQPTILQLNKRIAQKHTEGDVSGELDLFFEQLKTHQEAYGELNTNVATLYANIGISYNNLGRYAEAFKYKRKGLQLRQRLLESYDTHLADSFNDMGVSYAIIGNDEMAIQYLLGAVKIREANRQKDPRKLAPLYSMLATHLESVGDHAAAKKYQKKATKIAQEADNAFVSAYAYVNQAMSAIDRKKYAQAVHYLKKAEKFEQQKFKPDPLSLAQIQSTYAEAYLHWGKLDKALHYAQQALKSNQNTQTRYGTIEALGQLGWVYYAQKDFVQAHHYAKKAFDLFMQERESQFVVLDDNDKNSFLKKSHMTVMLLLESSFLARKDFAMAMATLNDWLRYKGSIFDSANMLSVAYDQATDPSLKERIETLSLAKRRLARLYQTRSQNNGKRVNDIQALNETIRTLTQKLGEKISGFNVLKELKNIQASDIADRLNPEDLYVDFARIRDSYFVYSITSDHHYDVYRISQKSYRFINRTIRAFRTTIKKGKKYSRKKLAKLYDRLLRPIIETKATQEKTHLVLSPDGLLHLFPFEALYDDKTQKYLLETHTIRYIPNGKELIRLRAQQETNSSNAIAVFAYPDYNIPDGVETNTTHKEGNRSTQLRIAFTPLPGAKAEAEAIQKIFADRPVTMYMEKNATEENLFALKSPEILHISTHGYFDRNHAPNPMLRSAIALAGANYAYTTGTGAGIITALKLSGMHLHGTGLVVLSACETGLMDADDTESISGLSKAFIVAGAKDVMVSLWSVSDRGTQRLMELFYQQVHDGLSYPEALRAAKIKMLRDGAPAFIWAPFILNGV